jgi:hypothetical protein
VIFLAVLIYCGQNIQISPGCTSIENSYGVGKRDFQTFVFAGKPNFIQFGVDMWKVNCILIKWYFFIQQYNIA